MNMTHYMQLLADNQPWNLLIFMAIPVVLAETLAITELYILFTRKFDGFVYHLNRFSGTTVGLYFIGIIAYLIRVFGTFPDGIAFGVLLMNICVPLIDMYTQPAIFGEKSKKDAS